MAGGERMATQECEWIFLGDENFYIFVKTYLTVHLQGCILLYVNDMSIELI